MTLTAEQHAMRKHGIGASEAAAVLGLSPWQTPSDVYWRKTMDTEPDAPNAAMTRGILLEPYILDHFEKELGYPLQRDVGTLVDPTSKVLMATPDAVVRGRPEAVEVKTTNVRDEWGEPGSAEIPDHYLVQTHHQMAVLNRAGIPCDRVYVPVLMFGFRPEFHVYVVDRDLELEQDIARRELAWWHTYVVPKQSPNDDPPALDVLKRLRREPASVIDLPATAADVLSVWEQTKDAAKQTKEEAEFAQAAALMLLDRHEAGRLPDGRLLTYLEQNTARQCDMDRLRTEFPDAYAQCSTQPKCRVLRIKKARK